MKALFFLPLILSSTLIFCAEHPINPVTTDIPKFPNSAAQAPHELAMLDQLIEITQQNLEREQALRQLILNYQDLQTQYLKNPEDKEQLYHVVKSAEHVLHAIEENHLKHVFNPDFIDELTLFANIARKRGVPRP